MKSCLLFFNERHHPGAWDHGSMAGPLLVVAAQALSKCSSVLLLSFISTSSSPVPPTPQLIIIIITFENLQKHFHVHHSMCLTNMWSLLLFYLHFIYLFLIYGCAISCFIAACKLSLVAMHRGYSSWRRVRFSLPWLLLVVGRGL